jgi:hypothetical protein
MHFPKLISSLIILAALSAARPLMVIGGKCRHLQPTCRYETLPTAANKVQGADKLSYIRRGVSDVERGFAGNDGSPEKRGSFDYFPEKRGLSMDYFPEKCGLSMDYSPKKRGSLDYSPEKRALTDDYRPKKRGIMPDYSPEKRGLHVVYSSEKRALTADYSPKGKRAGTVDPYFDPRSIPDVEKRDASFAYRRSSQNEHAPGLSTGHST